MEQNEITNIKPTVTEDINIKSVKPKSSIVLSILLVVSVLIITVLSAVVVIQQININREKEDNATIDCSTECADLQQTATPTVTPIETPKVNPTDIGEFTTYHSDELKLSLTYPNNLAALIDTGGSIRIGFVNDDNTSIHIHSYQGLRQELQLSQDEQFEYSIDGQLVTPYLYEMGEGEPIDPETGMLAYESEEPVCIMGFLGKGYIFDVQDKISVSLNYEEEYSDCPSNSYHKEPLEISKQQAKAIIESIKFD